MSKAPAVRPAVLRHYYETTYGGRGETAETFAGATFDEYVAIRRLRGPRLTARAAAVSAPRDDFRAQAEKLPPDPPRPEVPLPVTTHLERKAALDLRTAPFTRGSTRVIVDRVKQVSGWEGLRAVSGLDDLDVVFCACERGEQLEPPLALRKASIRECSDACLDLLLRGTRTRELDLVHSVSPALDLGLVAEHRRLETLTVTAPLLRGLASLDALPLHKLYLGRVEPDDDLPRLLAALAGTLADLALGGARPFGPDVLPDLPHLAFLRVPGYPEAREAWIDFAVAHPSIGCFFPTFTPPSPREPVLTVEEIYRGVDILRATKGAKVEFEIAANLAELVPDFPGDNGDLEDQVKEAARAAKRKKITWSSEADTFVARAPDVETCRFLIDAALGPEGPPAKGGASRPARRASRRG
jgi:hypothetical protein